MSKVFDLSIRVCSNCKYWMQYKSNPTMGKCQNPKSTANNAEMNEISYCDEFRLRRNEAKK
jgi:hypothetical protein